MSNNSRNPAPNEEERRRRELAEARARAGDTDPVYDSPDGQLGELDAALQTHTYPTTTEELIEAYGDAEIEIRQGSTTLTEVFAPVDNETYDSADGVRTRILKLTNRG